MPKKTKRPRRKATTRQMAPAPAAPVTNEPSAAAPRVATVAKATTATKVDLAQEYRYVFSDLRRIAITAALMFALLFILALVVR